MKKLFCIHAHFYQPPREDPLTNLIPLERGAAPYKNWNEKISAQCYQPNAELGNFEYISFNIGPTLLDWMASYNPEILKAIVAQDQTNVERYGCGNAMAQAYNHTILPLATRHDKETQVAWGIEAFRHYFGRDPQGMWLPETAVDVETLEVLAEKGIQFTILAPWQADEIKPETSKPYLFQLRDGKQIAIFFFRQDLSSRLSFDPAATINADWFANECIHPLYMNTKSSNHTLKFYMVATDGELYGHHQPFRDKFLARLVRESTRFWDIEMTYPGRILMKYPAQEPVHIRENTSWSCHHGVARWERACGCTPNGDWKEAFREVMNLIGVLIDNEFLRFFEPLTHQPWNIRHEYIKVLYGILSMEEFLKSRLNRELKGGEFLKARLLLEAQYERQRMFTSCGWYFEDFDRIEPQNNISYAAQAAWLTFSATGVDIRDKIMPFLRRVRSWRSGLSAEQVFQKRYELASIYKTA
mgnify:CR=1 FL=1